MAGGSDWEIWGVVGWKGWEGEDDWLGAKGGEVVRGWQEGDRVGGLEGLGLSLGESLGRDIGGLAGRGEASCLSLSLAVESRERDWSPEVSRRRSRGGA